MPNPCAIIRDFGGSPGCRSGGSGVGFPSSFVIRYSSFSGRARLVDNSLDPFYVRSVGAGVGGTVFENVCQVRLEVGFVKLRAEAVGLLPAEDGVEHRPAEDGSAMAVLEVVFHPSLDIALRRDGLRGGAGVIREVP